MSQAPLVSIIVNNYNYGRFLRDAIDSALHQTYRACEVIVVDDGSTDDSTGIIHDFGDRITAIWKQNGGQASALNAGFARASGEIIIFLDADDLLLPDTACRVVDVFQENPNVAKVMYRAEVIDAQGQRTGVIKPADRLSMRSGDLRPYVLAFPFDVTRMATSGNAFSAKILREIFPMPEHDFRILADNYLSHLAPLFGPVVALDYIGAYYRVHGANNYEVSTPTINLHHIRQTIVYSRNTNVYLAQTAHKLGLRHCCDERELLSVSYIANRVVSLKLEPRHHPIEGDTLPRLLVAGVTAALQRFDVPWSTKLAFVLWFVAVVPAPKRLARWLATIFFFPETRGQLGRLLGVL